MRGRSVPLSRPRRLVGDLMHFSIGVPRVPRQQRWLHEGAATYIEAVARTRAGGLQPADVWRGWMKQMPQGQRQNGAPLVPQVAGHTGLVLPGETGSASGGPSDA